jgi:hypothetical protein
VKPVGTGEVVLASGTDTRMEENNLTMKLEVRASLLNHILSM